MKDMEFVEYYESKAQELQLLKLLQGNLTEKGRETFIKIEKWLIKNLDKYLAEISQSNLKG